MNDIGKRIEARRTRIGLTREALGERLGVTAQTILNIERDPGYNLGTRLLRRLEGALGVEFTILMTEPEPQKETNVSERIRMGNDEFILYIRKHYKCEVRNPQLGRRIWVWLRDHADGEKVSDQQDCLWGTDIAALGERRLPGSATQFEFRIDAMPDLYRFLGQIGEGSVPTEAEENAEEE